MAITASDVNDLRQKTGVGMMDCKKALTEANGDMDKADRNSSRKGHGDRREKGGQDRSGRHCRQLYPHGRQGRRSRRSQLRNRLRGARRSVQRTRTRHRTCRSRRAKPTVRHEGRSSRRACSSEEKKILKVSGNERGQTRSHRRKDGRRAASKNITKISACSNSRSSRIPPRPSTNSLPKRSRRSARRSRSAVSLVSKWAKASKRRRTTSPKKSKNKFPR